MQLQVVYTEALESPSLFRRKALNSTQDKGSLTAWFRRLCKCQQKLILLQKKQAVNGVRLKARGAGKFGTTGLNLEERIHAELVVVRKFSSVYLTEAAVGTRFHISLGVRSLIRKSPQEHLDSCARLSVARMRVGCYCCAAWHSLIELLQTGWLTRWVWRN